jgi:hypothetical protein
MHVPKAAGATEVKSALVTASASDATLVLETFNFPGKLDGVSAADIKADARFKLSVLGGSVRVCRANQSDECITVRSGQMLVGTANSALDQPRDFKVTKWMSDSSLISGFSPLSKEILGPIQTASNNVSLARSANAAPAANNPEAAAVATATTVQPTETTAAPAAIASTAVSTTVTPALEVAKPGETVTSGSSASAGMLTTTIGASAAGNSVGTINPANLGSDASTDVVSESEDKETICHNGHNLTIPHKAAQKHLANHPTDTAGPCH